MSGTKAKNKVKSESVEEKLARMEKENEELKTELQQLKLTKSKMTKSQKLMTAKSAGDTVQEQLVRAIVNSPLDSEKSLRKGISSSSQSGYYHASVHTLAYLLSEDLLSEEYAEFIRCQL